MELKRETICENTLEFIQEYYRLNTGPLFSVLSDDCVWLGPGNLLVHGREAIRALFQDGFVMPAFDVVEPDFRLVDTGCAEQLTVLGQYTCYPVENAQLISAARQRATFCYRLEEDNWRLYHMHVSNEWNELVGDEVFPVQISTQTYRYVQKLLEENRSKASPTLTIKTDIANQFVDTGAVLYIQATDRTCILHMLHEWKQVSKPLKDLQTQLPPNFYRLHRSFCVNSDYVTEIKRYTVTLVTGEELPIPKMRYTQVREELTALIEKKP